MPKIQIKSGEKKGASYKIQSEWVSIGRDPLSDIVLPDNRVSRKHARIISSEKGVIIEDLGSTNGTFVNNRQITKEKIDLNDNIRIGDTILELTDEISGSSSGISLDKSDEFTFETKEADSSNSISLEVVQAADFEEEGMNVDLRVNPEEIEPLEKDLDQFDINVVSKAYERLATLYKLSRDIGSLEDLPKLLNKIMNLVLTVMKADRGVIMLIDQSSGELVPAVALGKKELIIQKVKVSKSIINQVLETGDAVLTSDAMKDARFSAAESVVHQNIHSAISVPLKTKGSVLGIMYIDNSSSLTPFSKGDTELMVAMANEIAMSIENARLYNNVMQANMELQKKQEQLIESEKLSALGKMASGIAHEVNNPLTSIINYVELTLRQMIKDEEFKLEEKEKCIGYLKIVQKEGQRCLNITQNLLQFARRKKGEFKDINLNEILEDTVAIAQYQIKIERMTIENKLAEKLPVVFGDASQLQQVFLNLIMNARDAMSDGGILIIKTEDTQDGFVKITFSDTGTGIAKENLAKVFEALFTTKQEGKGTGLGLSLSREIVKRHKGSIDVESELGKGTTFIIKLPVKTNLQSRSIK